MSGFLRATALGSVILACLAVATIEAICWGKGAELRAPLYWGVAAGFLINLLSYPFVLKMAVLSPEDVKSGVCWNWWLGGALVRSAAIGLMVAAIRGRFSGHESDVRLAAIAMYMAGMFAELAWLSRRINAMDKR